MHMVALSENQPISLLLIKYNGTSPTVIRTLFGGQNTKKKAAPKKERDGGFSSSCEAKIDAVQANPFGEAILDPHGCAVLELVFHTFILPPSKMRETSIGESQPMKILPFLTRNSPLSRRAAKLVWKNCCAAGNPSLYKFSDEVFEQNFDRREVELALPAIAVSLATSLVAAPYLLIRNYYHLYPGQATKAGDLGCDTTTYQARRAVHGAASLLTWSMHIAFSRRLAAYPRSSISKRIPGSIWFSIKFGGSSTPPGPLGDPSFIPDDADDQSEKTKREYIAELQNDKTLNLQYRNALVKQEKIAQKIWDILPNRSFKLEEVRTEVDIYLTDTMAREGNYRNNKLNGILRDLEVKGDQSKAYKDILESLGNIA
ncbi:Endochitinase 2 [Bienertia sinuspersici]